jgi:hypothetical protein
MCGEGKKKNFLGCGGNVVEMEMFWEDVDELFIPIKRCGCGGLCGWPQGNLSGGGKFLYL